MGQDDGTLRRATFTLDVLAQDPIGVVVPRAPGSFLGDVLSCFAKRRRAKACDALEKALRSVIDGLPYPDGTRAELSVERGVNAVKVVRLMRGACIACTEWEVCFFYDGSVVLRDDEFTAESGRPDRWTVPTWDEGFRRLVGLLMSDAETDLLNAAERMDVLKNLRFGKK